MAVESLIVSGKNEAMTLKRLKVLLVIFLIPAALYSQREKVKNRSWYDEKLFHFGFSVGLNTMDFKITPSQTAFVADSLFPEITSLNPGINISDCNRFSSGKLS
jgi:hypothetical protein